MHSFPDAPVPGGVCVCVCVCVVEALWRLAGRAMVWCVCVCSVLSYLHEYLFLLALYGSG